MLLLSRVFRNSRTQDLKEYTMDLKQDWLGARTLKGTVWGHLHCTKLREPKNKQTSDYCGSFCQKNLLTNKGFPY